MAITDSTKVIVFTAYQQPKKRGYSIDILIDGTRYRRICSGSFRTYHVEPGVHQVEVHRGKEVAKVDRVESAPGQPTLLVAGIDNESPDVRRSGKAPRKVWVQLCKDTSQLPKCSIPLTSPTGKFQSLEQGRMNALVAAVLMQLVALSVLVFGIAIVVGAFSHAVGHQLAGLILAAIGVWVTFRMVKVFRLIITQWNWPFPDWRAESKSEAMNEWKRWTREPQ